MRGPTVTLTRTPAPAVELDLLAGAAADQLTNSTVVDKMACCSATFSFGPSTMPTAPSASSSPSLSPSLSLPSKPVLLVRSPPAPRQVVRKPIQSASSSIQSPPSSSTKSIPMIDLKAISHPVQKRRQQDGELVVKPLSSVVTPSSPPQILNPTTLNRLMAEEEENVHTHPVGDDGEEEELASSLLSLVQPISLPSASAPTIVAPSPMIEITSTTTKEEEARLLALKKVLDDQCFEDTFIFSDEAEELLSEALSSNEGGACCSVGGGAASGVGGGNCNCANEEEEEEEVVVNNSTVKKNGTNQQDQAVEEVAMMLSSPRRKRSRVKRYGETPSSLSPASNATSTTTATAGPAAQKQGVKRPVASTTNATNATDAKKERPTKRLKPSGHAAVVAAAVKKNKKAAATKKTSAPTTPTKPAPAQRKVKRDRLDLIELECISVRVERDENTSNSSSSYEDEDCVVASARRPSLSSSSSWAFGADLDDEELLESVLSGSASSVDGASPPSPSSPLYTLDEEDADDEELNDHHHLIHDDIEIGDRCYPRRSARLHLPSASTSPIKRRPVARKQQQQRAQQHPQQLKELLYEVEKEKERERKKKENRYTQYTDIILGVEIKERDMECKKEIQRLEYDTKDEIENIQKEMYYSVSLLEAYLMQYYEQIETNTDIKEIQILKQQLQQMKIQLQLEQQEIYNTFKDTDITIRDKLINELKQIEKALEEEFEECIKDIQLNYKQQMLLSCKTKLRQFYRSCDQDFEIIEKKLDIMFDKKKKFVRHSERDAQRQRTALYNPQQQQQLL